MPELSRAAQLDVVEASFPGQVLVAKSLADSYPNSIGEVWVLRKASSETAPGRFAKNGGPGSIGRNLVQG
jgi:hypothetical protein